MFWDVVLFRFALERPGLLGEDADELAVLHLHEDEASVHGLASDVTRRDETAGVELAHCRDRLEESRGDRVRPVGLDDLLDDGVEELGCRPRLGAEAVGPVDGLEERVERVVDPASSNGRNWIHVNCPSTASPPSEISRVL